MENNGKGYKLIESTRKSFEILEYLSKANRPVSPGELAQTTGMPQATIMSHLATLETDGYAEKYGTEYILGMGCAMLWGRYRDYLLAQKAQIAKKLTQMGAENDGYSGSTGGIGRGISPGQGSPE